VPGLVEPINRVEEDSTVRIVGPVIGTDAVVVGAVVERRPRQVAPLREVLAEVKRRADAEKQRIASESERRAYYEAHRDHWRSRRGSVTRVTLNGATLAVPAPTAKEVERWYAEHGHSLFGRPNDSKAWLPPLSDSLRSQTAARITEERRSQRAAEILKGVVDGDRFVLDPRGTAGAQGARPETLWVMAGSNQDTIFEGPFVDSLLAPAGAARGKVQGPRAFGDYSAVWRLDSVDTSYVQPYSAVGSQSDREFEEERARRDEAEARAHFEQHRDDYKTPVRYALDFVAVRIPFPDSVSIPEREIRRHYDANVARYAREEQVRARHILFMTRDAGPEVEQQAKKRADSLLTAIRKDGGDFAELAKRFSQEPGAAVTGGDLGWFGRGRMVREFEQAAFALDSGEVSPVVKTAFGYHIIKLEGRKAAGTKPFDEVRNEIRRSLAAARGDSIASHAANALARALASGGDAKTLAARYGGCRVSRSLHADRECAEAPVAACARAGSAEDAGRQVVAEGLPDAGGLHRGPRPPTNRAAAGGVRRREGPGPRRREEREARLDPEGGGEGAARSARGRHVDRFGRLRPRRAQGQRPHPPVAALPGVPGLRAARRRPRLHAEARRGDGHPSDKSGCGVVASRRAGNRRTRPGSRRPRPRSRPISSRRSTTSGWPRRRRR
jgi:hypothetical protein